ncbi:MAG: hypothetical protein IKA08_03795 [Alphaproteobacteria bacterium]|nr:hypothetical protein [Alphaproteobacteria bacterium]
MFGISWAEFFVVLLVAVLVIPARHWPDVARFLARAVKFVRGVVWRITDASEKIKEQIEREAPIDQLIKTTTDDILAEISEPINKVKRKSAKKSGGKNK